MVGGTGTFISPKVVVELSKIPFIGKVKCAGTKVVEIAASAIA